jgi:hypothetical protein
VSGILLVSFCNLNLARPDAPPLALLPDPAEPVLLIPTEPLPGIVGITGLFADERFVYAVGQSCPAPGTTGNAARLSELLTFDRADLSLRDRYTFRLGRDVHSLTAVDGGLIAVSTGTDALIELALRDGEVQGEHVHWRADPVGEPADHVHLNAVVNRHGTGTLLVSGFGRRTGPTWTSARDGFVREVATRTGAPGPILATGLPQPHSLLLDGDRVLLCASRTRTVCTLSGDRFAALPGYARGLCHDGPAALCIGTSVGRRTSRSRTPSDSTPIANPHDPGTPTGDCAILRVDRTNGRELNRVVLSPRFTEIYDLLPLDPPPTIPPDWIQIAGN